MKLKIEKSKLNEYKSRDLLPCECEFCGKEFLVVKNEVQRALKNTRVIECCSKECSAKNKTLKNRTEFSCLICGKRVFLVNSQFKKYKNHFCSLRCAALYNNAHKEKGSKVSKLEIWLSKKLPVLFPTLEFQFNRKDTINSELDIYIPSLRLAFELNGIFHYEPIYGKEKLEAIQNNDCRKFQACLERGIELCIVDSSKQKYFKEESSKMYLNLIVQIINKKISPA